MAYRPRQTDRFRARSRWSFISFTIAAAASNRPPKPYSDHTGNLPARDNSSQLTRSAALAPHNPADFSSCQAVPSKPFRDANSRIPLRSSFSVIIPLSRHSQGTTERFYVDGSQRSRLIAERPEVLRYPHADPARPRHPALSSRLGGAVANCHASLTPHRY